MATRRRLVALTVGVGLLLGTVGPVAAADFSFSGAGWGHGVGLSQYGSKAMGADGASYEQVVAAGPTAEFEAKWGDPGRFLTAVYAELAGMD